MTSGRSPLTTHLFGQTTRRSKGKHGPILLEPVIDLAGRALGEILIAQGVVSPEKVDEALNTQAERGGRLGDALISLKACNEEQILKALAAQLELPYQMRLTPEEVAQDLVKLVPINFAKQARLLPLRIEGDGERQAIVALSDPLDTGTLDSVRLKREMELFRSRSPNSGVWSLILSSMARPPALPEINL